MGRQETRDSLSRNLRMLQRHVSKTEREMQQINQTLIEQNERKRVDLLAAQERIAELEAENSALRRRLSDRPALRDRLDELLKLETLTDEQRAEIDRINGELSVESAEEKRYLDILRRAAVNQIQAERLQANIAEAHAEAMRLGPIDG